jgi:acyl carrier protein
VALPQHPEKILTAPQLLKESHDLIFWYAETWLVMSIMSASIQQLPAPRSAFNTVEIRILVAKHLDVDIKRVTDDANFIDDLGADWLDRLELMILIEDRFGGLEITDDDADRIQVVGDLIRYIESWIQKGLRR